MEVNATCIQKVEINPKDVIEKLIEDRLGYDGWVFKENNKFYKSWEEYEYIDHKEEISKEMFDYINALQLVLKYLNK